MGSSVFRGLVRVGMSGAIGSLFRLGLASAQVLAEPVDRLVRNDQAGRNGRRAVRDQALASDVLVLGVVDLEDVVLGLGALAHGEEDDALAVAPELARGLLQDGESRVHLGEHLVADRVSLLDVRRHVLVRLREVGDHGLRERLVRRVAQLYRLLAIGVLLDVG